MTLHVVTGYNDTSFADLASMYGVSSKSIITANYGSGAGATSIYNWLSQHDGTQQAEDPNVATGYHWSLSPEMVVEIPGVSVSKSPLAGGDYKPGGPLVSIPASSAVEDYSTSTSTSTSTETVGVSPGEAVPVPEEAAIMGGGDLWTWAAVGFLGFLLFSGKGKKKRTYRKRTSRRKTTRRTTRRRRR